MKWIKKTIVFFGALVFSLAIFSSYQALQSDRKKDEKRTPGEVIDVIEVKVLQEKLKIRSSGIVEAVKKVQIRPFSSGVLIYLSPSLEIGKSVRKGEVLARIDPTDHIALLEEERANLKRAEYEYKVEIGKKRIAENEWKLIGSGMSVDPIGEELVLRGPQIENKKAQLLAAEKRLEKAERDLHRTEIKAPFDGIVLKDAADIGLSVTSDSEIAEILQTDHFRVIVSIPYERICNIACLSKDAMENRKAYVFQELGDGIIVVKEGVAVRLLGDLDPSGAMARAVVLVDDPLGLEGGKGAEVPLFLGSHVQVEIEGPDLGEVVKLPLSALNAAGEVNVLRSDGLLEPRKVDVRIVDGNIAYVSKGLQEGEKVVIEHRQK